MGRRKKPIQLKVKNVKFQFDQYWSIKYTEISPGSTDQDYKVIIKSRSSELARRILKNKSKESNPGCKLKGISINMLHTNSVINGLRLTVKDWECIKDAAFPNSVNVLFRFTSLRTEKQKVQLVKLRKTQPKFNVNKISQNFSKEEKNHMRWEGKWKPWPKAERDAFKERMSIGLKLNNNCRFKAAKYIGVSQRYFQQLLKKFPEVDWVNDFPVQYYKFNESDNSKRITGIRASKKKLKQAYIDSMTPKVIALLEKGDSFNSICKSLKTSKITINNCIKNHEYKK